MSDSAQHRHHGPRDFSIPENHLDAVVTPDSFQLQRRASLGMRIGVMVALPLFFVVSFVLCYTSALHKPTPYNLELTIAGPSSVTAQLSSAITSAAPNAFEVTRTTDLDAAKQRVVTRDAVGAVLVSDDNEVTTVVASAGGQLADQTVREVGEDVAAKLGTTATVVDVAPVSSRDTSGTALFSLLIACTVGGYLAITVLTQAFPRARTGSMLATAAGTAVVAPIVAFAMISGFVGDFGLTFGDMSAVLGVAMVYTLAVGMVATLLTRLLGQAAIFAEVLLLMAFNFPSAGAASPASMLPPFWQAIHDSWIGAAAFETMRSIVYFDGNQVGRWFLQLGMWAGVAVVITLVLGLTSVLAAKTAELEAAEAAAAAAGPAPLPDGVGAEDFETGELDLSEFEESEFESGDFAPGEFEAVDVEPADVEPAEFEPADVARDDHERAEVPGVRFTGDDIEDAELAEPLGPPEIDDITLERIDYNRPQLRRSTFNRPDFPPVEPAEVPEIRRADLRAAEANAAASSAAGVDPAGVDPAGFGPAHSSPAEASGATFPGVAFRSSGPEFGRDGAHALSPRGAAEVGPSEVSASGLGASELNAEAGRVAFNGEFDHEVGQQSATGAPPAPLEPERSVALPTALPAVLPPTELPPTERH